MSVNNNPGTYCDLWYRLSKYYEYYYMIMLFINQLTTIWIEMTILYEPEISTAGHYELEIPTAGHYEITVSHYEITASHY